VAFIFQDFGSDVVGGAADGFFLFAVVLEFGGEAEVAEFDLHVFVDEEVS
jgi:hypothetical protein